MSSSHSSFTRRAALAAAFCTIALSASFDLVHAHGFTIGDLEIGHPWSRATPPSARVAGGYLTITNKGQTADRLVSATFAGSNSTEVHEMRVEGGVMQMRELPRGIEIKPGETLELKPGSYHLMFMGLKQGLKESDSLKGELVFENAGRVEVAFKVEAIGFKREVGANDLHHDHGQPDKVKTQ